jgi:N4-gp56 family major capsid protein
MAQTTSTTGNLNLDQEKFLVGKLLDRSYLNLVMGSLCDKLQMRDGAGRTAYMVRYKRMNVPVATLTEGSAGTSSNFEVEEVTVTLDQWGDWLEITDVAQLTTKHPVMQQSTLLLADNAARVMDREICVVMLAGTNIIFGDGSVTSRNAINETMTISDGLLKDARAQLANDGAPAYGSPAGDAKEVATGFSRGQGYILVCGPEIVNDISSPSVSYGTFVSYANFNDSSKLLTAEIGKWLNFRVLETNFIPRFTRLGNTTIAVASAADFGTGTPVVTALDGPAGGTLTSATSYAYKVTRKDLLRGFEESISIIHTTTSTATGNNEGFSFAMPATAGFVYNVYFDKTSASTTDAGLGLVASNVAAGATATVLAVAATAAAQPPGSVGSATNTTIALIHPVFIVAQSALAWVGFYKPRMLMSPNTATKDDPLAQKRTVGYKFFGKAVIKDQTRLLRLEVANA